MDASPRPRLPRTVIALGFTSLFTDIGGDMLYPLLPVFLASLGAGPAFLGLLEGVADALSAGLKYVSGRVADGRARKPMVLFGYGLAGLARPLLALATAPWQVLAVRLIDRMGKGVRSAPRDLLLSQAVAREDAGRAFGFHQAMDHAGAVVGPLLATGLLAAGVPLRTIFAVTLIPGVLAILAVLVVREAPAPTPGAEVAASPAPLPPRLSTGPSAPPQAEGRAPPATAAPLPPRLWAYFGILFFFALSNSSDVFLLLRARELGVAEALIPILWVLLSGSKMAFASVGGAWSDRVPRHRLIIAGWLIYAVVYAGLGVATAGWQVWGLFAVYGAFYGLTEPVEKALVRDLAPEAVRGRAYGLYNGMLGLAAIPAGLLTGGLWQAFGALPALGTGAAVALVASVGLAVWARGDGAAPLPSR